MSGRPDVAPVYAWVACACDYRPPITILIISQINSICTPVAGGQPAGCYYFVTDHIGAAIKGPAIDYVANGLPSIRVAWTAVYLYGAVVIADRLLGQKGHKNLIPGLSTIARRPAGNV